MRERALGRTGLKVSVLGLGCNNFGARIDAAATERVVHAALDAGINLFDTADVYGRGQSEEFLGRALGARRREAIILTRFGLPMDDAAPERNASFNYVMTAVEASLKRLQTDWIDLYLLHRDDPATPIEETLRALDSLVRQGKVRHIGCSNLPAAQIVAAQRAAAAHGFHGFVCCQDQYNLLSREIEQDLIPVVAAEGLALLPYFPLAAGMLTGKYHANAPLPEGARLSTARYADRFLNTENFAVVEALRGFCAKRNRSLVELAFAWLLAKPAIASVTTGASTPAQLHQNAASMAWELSPAELAEVDALTAP